MNNKLLPVILLSFLTQFSVAADYPKTVRVYNFEIPFQGQMPQGWSVWKVDDIGQVATDNIGYKSRKSIKVSGAKNVALTYDLRVIPGETYIVESLCRQTCDGTPALHVNWKNSNRTLNKYAGFNQAKFKSFDGEWKKAQLKVVVPKDITYLSLVLTAEGQKNPQDAVWFDDVKIIKPTSKLVPMPEPDEPAPLVEVDLKDSDYHLFTSNLEALSTLRMASLKHNDNIGDEGVAKWITPNSVRKFAKFMRDSGFNVILTEGQRYLMSDTREHPVYPDVLKGSLPFPELVKNTKTIVDACHAEGMKVFLHLTACAAPMEMREKHPDWMTVDVNDGKMKSTWGLEWLCLNNPEFRREYLKRLEKLIAETKCDGLMLDETTLMYDTCGCKNCREKFKRETGMTMPPQGTPWFRDLTNPIYKKFLEWRLQQCLEFNGEVLAILKKYTPDGMMLSYYAVPYIPTAWYEHGASNEIAAMIGQANGLEAISNYEQYWALYIANMKIVRSTAEHKIGSTFTIKAYNNYTQMHYFWLLSLSQGSHQYWSWYMNDDMKKARQPLVQWEMKNSDLLAGLYSAADTGVVISTRSNNLHSSPLGSLKFQNSYFAVAETLTAAQIPFKAVGDMDIDQPLSGKCKTLIALNLSLMSEAQAKNIRQFVSDGGTLIAALDTSLYDENGNRRPNFALADVFGCDYVATIEKEGVMSIDKSQRLFGDVTGKFSSPDVSVEVKPLDDAEIWGSIDIDGKKLPGIVYRKYSKGQIVYFAGHIEPLIYFDEFNGVKIIPRPYGDDRNMQMVRLFTSLVKNTADDKVQVDNLPAGVVVETYRHDYKGHKGFMVCLFNATGLYADGKPFKQRVNFPDIKSQLPDKGQPILVHLKDAGVTKAFAISPDFKGKQELQVLKNGNDVSIKLPNFGRLIMIYFE